MVKINLLLSQQRLHLDTKRVHYTKFVHIELFIIYTKQLSMEEMVLIYMSLSFGNVCPAL
jgi:hypothetical protein